MIRWIIGLLLIVPSAFAGYGLGGGYAPDSGYTARAPEEPEEPPPPPPPDPSDVRFAIVNAVAPKAITNQVFESAGFGTPKAAIFLYGGGEVDDTPINHARIAMSVTDGTSHYTMMTRYRNGNAASDTDYIGATNLIWQMNETGTLNEGIAQFKAWTANGIEIDWTTIIQEDAFKITCVLIGGDDVTAKVGAFQTSGTINGTVSPTVGFPPQLLWTLNLENVGFTASDQTTSRVGWGLAAKVEGVIQERSIFHRETNNANPTAVYMNNSTNYIWDVMGITENACEYEITDMGATTFSVISRDLGTVNWIAYLALNVGDRKFNVGTWTTPTSTGSSSVVGLGFKPQLVWTITTFHEVLGNFGQIVENSLAGTYGMGAFTGSAIGYHTVQTADNVTPADTQSVFSQSKLTLPTHTGTTGINATFTSLDSGGWTWNFTNATANAKHWFYLAVEENN